MKNLNLPLIEKLPELLINPDRIGRVVLDELFTGAEQLVMSLYPDSPEPEA